MIKTPIETSIQGTYFNIYDKPTVNIILNSGKLKAFVQGQEKADNSFRNRKQAGGGRPARQETNTKTKSESSTRRSFFETVSDKK